VRPMSTALLPPVWQLAQSGRFDEFAAAYQPGDAALVWEDGQTLLHRSLINGDLPARIAISSFLLDEGANAAARSHLKCTGEVFRENFAGGSVAEPFSRSIVE